MRDPDCALSSQLQLDKVLAVENMWPVNKQKENLSAFASFCLSNTTEVNKNTLRSQGESHAQTREGWPPRPSQPLLPLPCITTTPTPHTTHPQLGDFHIL